MSDWITKVEALVEACRGVGNLGYNFDKVEDALAALPDDLDRFTYARLTDQVEAIGNFRGPRRHVGVPPGP